MEFLLLLVAGIAVVSVVSAAKSLASIEDRMVGLKVTLERVGAVLADQDLRLDYLSDLSKINGTLRDISRELNAIPKIEAELESISVELRGRERENSVSRDY